MVQNLGYVTNAGSAVDYAQQKVIILCPIKAFANAAKLVGDRLFDNHEMRNIVEIPEHIQREVWFKVRLEVSVARLANLILVRVDKSQGRILPEEIDRLK